MDSTQTAAKSATTPLTSAMAGGAAVATQHIPDIKLAQLRYTLVHADESAARDVAFTELVAAIREHAMAPFYAILCEESKRPVDAELMAALEERNATQLRVLHEKIEDAEKNAGETEISDALIAKAEYLARIGDKTKAIAAYKDAFEKTPGVGAKIDLVFAIVRVGFFFNDREIVGTQIAKAKILIESGGDWDRRNRCKVYEATHLMSQRDFGGAAPLFLETLATFMSFELMTNAELLLYTVLTASLVLTRTEMKKQVIDSPEIAEFIAQVPHLDDYMRALFECRYGVFFETLAHMEAYMKRNMYLHAHYRYYVREMRIKAYAQLLESYRSLTLEYMACAFGVTIDFIDADLFRFISSGRLNCVIDRVRGIVTTNRPDSKNAQYQQLIKQGDLLLNRVQKLGRIISI